ncbi:rod shape-determining protein MreC [Salinicoccus halitifaciens]|uniref:Cell shape-determining protein MreC n=1 Tax=Salinicoccus halitifaciens TaxID=1073415 RepID=A0ABV2E6V9_9STAP|nr:rod shape-determining protein MreC [Salinicoccus halitifaciens]MCD2136776.1 rod shape-determining protein MreC [Salinicoccus halitifaciens]
MNKLLNRNKMLIILFGIIILIVFIGFSMTDRSSTTKAEQFTGDTVAASQSIIGAPVQFVSNIFSSVTGMFGAATENEALRAQLEMMPQMYADIERLEAENEKLRDALEVSAKRKYNTINSRVISRSQDQWLNNFTIDKGENDGIEEGMAVMTPEGLIGTVKRVNGNSSFVEMITTSVSQNNLSVEIHNGDDTIYGAIDRYDSEKGLLVIDNIQNTATVEAGDPVFTSGLTGDFPEGLNVGEVVQVENDEYGLSQNAFIQLFSDPSEVDVVFVLERDPESQVD